MQLELSGETAVFQGAPLLAPTTNRGLNRGLDFAPQGLVR